MNILFISYNDFTSNSAIQIHSFANHLVRLGHSCIVAVPSNKNTVFSAIGGEVLYCPLEFADFENLGNLFQYGGYPDIIHAWTPREIVRKKCMKLVNKYKSKLIIHLEDNEEQIIADSLGLSLDDLRDLSPEEINSITPDFLSNLYLYRNFLDMADGITIIMDTLSEFIPKGKKFLILWPGLDKIRFQVDSADYVLKASLGIKEGTLVLCYTGNVHNSNSREVRSLYLAVTLLNRIGIPTVLVRTGVDHIPFLGTDSSWAHQYSIELGFVQYGMVPKLLNIADILIQPGKNDNFNAYRLPSKIPEFLCMKKPVILPNVNIGRFIADGKEGLLLNEGGALEILEKVKFIYENPILANKLSHNGFEFARKSFDLDQNTKKLEIFYEKIINIA